MANETEIEWDEHLLEELRGNLITICSAAFAAVSFYLNMYRPNAHRKPIISKGFSYILTKLEWPPDEFRELYRMYPQIFCKLCRILKKKSLLVNTQYFSVEEMVAMFLLTVGQNSSYSVSRDTFKCSRWTAIINFNKTLKALTILSQELMETNSTNTLTKILSDDRFYPYFQNFLGAIAGTYIPAMVPVQDYTTYTNRKGIISQNVLAACTFDLQFIYFLSGWEGLANDARVLNNALARRGGLKDPRGKFYLVDARYSNRAQFLAPFRGVRYHFREFGNGNHPDNGKELFNLRHSSLRTAIERIFGIFKSRFKIFKTAPQFPFKSQARLVVACDGLHNYLRRECSSGEFTPHENEDGEENNTNEDLEIQTQEQQREQANEWRDGIAITMWNDTTSGE